MPDNASFGSWLKQRRKTLDLTQADLARLAGCATVTIHKIEADGLRPSRQMAEQLAVALEIPPGEREHFLQAARWRRIQRAARGGLRCDGGVCCAQRSARRGQLPPARAKYAPDRS